MTDIDLHSKSMDWFLYDNGLRHERVNVGYFMMKFYSPTNTWQASLLF